MTFTFPDVTEARGSFAPLLEHVAKVLDADYCLHNPLTVGTWPIWEDRTPEFRAYERWAAGDMLAVLLGLHTQVRMERIRDRRRYLVAGRAALECACFLHTQPGWEDIYTEAVCRRFDEAIRKYETETP